MATVACAEAAFLPVKMLAKLYRHLQSVSLYKLFSPFLGPCAACQDDRRAQR